MEQQVFLVLQSQSGGDCWDAHAHPCLRGLCTTAPRTAWNLPVPMPVSEVLLLREGAASKWESWIRARIRTTPAENGVSLQVAMERYW